MRAAVLLAEQTKRAIGEVPEPGVLKLSGLVCWIVVAAAAFHVAYASARTNVFIALYLFGLAQLARAATWRKAFYSGLLVGLLIAIGRLEFFWNIFSAGAIALWLVYAFWLGLFVALARLALGYRLIKPPAIAPSTPPDLPRTTFKSQSARLPSQLGWVVVPFVWLGLEYFRSELYYLRFSWLNPGFAFAAHPAQFPFNHAGVYGLGFFLMCFACAAAFIWQKSRTGALAVLFSGVVVLRLWGLASAAAVSPRPSAWVRLVGIQMEFPTEAEVLLRLDEVLRKHPETDLVVLSEYTFSEPVPEKVRDWCRKNQRYLVVGGKDPAPGHNFYDTAFVVDPIGDIVFRQVKAVPIQFFKDGLPARQQKLWDSPWGKIGICVCYDLSYSRVTDRLVKLGARAIIVPTMDVMDWGKCQHELHARVAPVRAAEYGLPIFRLASSGISQCVDRTGRVVATAPCPGDGAIISGTLDLRGTGGVPLDRWLAALATGLIALLIVILPLVRRRTPQNL